MAPSRTKDDGLTSKKLVAYLVAELTWKALLITGLLVFRDDFTAAGMFGWSFMIITVIVAGFVEVVYIGKQADLDRYVRVAEITAGKVLDVVDGNNESTPPPVTSTEISVEDEPTDPGK
jgi:hypothetical protein